MAPLAELIIQPYLIIGTFSGPSNTPNANMADHSVVARDELHESEVSQSSMFCFENAFAMPTSCCVPDCDEGIEIFHRSPLRENSGSMQFVASAIDRFRSIKIES